MIKYAEVLEVTYNPKESEEIYKIRAKIIDYQVADDSTSITVVDARPLNYNVLKVPIVGEVVALIYGTSSQASALKGAVDIYYTDIVSLQNSVHHNAIPTVSKIEDRSSPSNTNSNAYKKSSTGNPQKSSPPKIDKNFVEKTSVSFLQNYPGDVLIQGRFGNSLRLSYTPKSISYTDGPKFFKKEGSPITILRNSLRTSNTILSSEDFDKDDSTFLLTSGQEITLKQSSEVDKSMRSVNLTDWKSDKFGNTPAAMLISGRVVLNSISKDILLFSKRGIALSASEAISIDSSNEISVNSKEIKLGTDADEPVILGNAWKDWMDDFFTQLSNLTVITPNGPSSPLKASPTWAAIELLKPKLQTLLSKQTFVKKSN